MNHSHFIVGNSTFLFDNFIMIKNYIIESIIFQFKTQKYGIFSISSSEFEYNFANSSIISILFDISGFNVLFKAEKISFIQNQNFKNIISISNTFSDIYLEKINLENNSANELIYFTNVGKVFISYIFFIKNIINDKSSSGICLMINECEKFQFYQFNILSNDIPGLNIVQSNNFIDIFNLSKFILNF